MLDPTSPFVLDWRTILGLGVSVLVAFISGPGGQGGGSFYIVIFSVLLGFSTNQASALSAAVVFFGCITMVVQAVATSHPQLPILPVIDYTLVLAMTPSLIVGLALGVLVNAVISQWLLNLMIIAIWTWSSIRLCFSYRQARAGEKQQQQQKQGEQTQQQGSCKPAGDVAEAATVELVVCCSSSDSSEGSHVAAATTSSSSIWSWLSSSCAGAVAAVCAWASYQPWLTIAAIVLLFSLFIVSQVVQAVYTPTCSGGYWAVMGVLCGVGGAAAIAVSVWLLRAEKKKKQCHVGAVGPDTLPQTTPVAMEEATTAAANNGTSRNSISSSTSDEFAVQLQQQQQPAACSSSSSSASVVCWTRAMLAGVHVQMVVAGLMLGAWPLSPIILAIPGMHPQVGAGTSKLMLLMITAGTGLSFIAQGNINLSYMLVFGLTNAVATPIGVWVVDWAIKRTGRPSVIIMLTIVRLMACVVLQAALQAVPSLIALAHHTLPRAGFLAQPFCKA